MILTLTSNNTANPQTIDLSGYVNVQQGEGLDFADPQFSQKVFAHSLLRAGATEALEQNVERELMIPLILGPVGGLAGAPTTLSQTLALIAQINAALRSGAATLTWQADGASQPTVYDGISGQVDVEYDFRREQQRWTAANLRFFAQPFGRTAAPRPYAAASGVGPLLMITPYASSGAQAIGASTQAGAAGFGGKPAGASTGVFYTGNPSLAGDAPASLQISYVGPRPAGASNFGAVPYVAVSLLPDALYQPLVSVAQMSLSGNAVVHQSSTAVASQYVTLADPTLPTSYTFAFPPTSPASAPAALWAGSHRLFAIARASTHTAALTLLSNSIVPQQTTASVLPGDWAVYDLGVITITPSQYPYEDPVVWAQAPGVGAQIDVTAFVTLPDNATWFLNPTVIQPAQYGWTPNTPQNQGPYTNTVLLDDILEHQFIYAGASQTFAPSPIGSVPSSARITPYTRGLVPRPDPKNGLPIIAILGVGQNFTSSSIVQPFPGASQANPGASWSNAQNFRTMAQVTVLERTRYVLP